MVDSENCGSTAIGSLGHVILHRCGEDSLRLRLPCHVPRAACHVSVLWAGRSPGEGGSPS